MSDTNNHVKFLAFERGQIVLAAVSAIVGAILGWAVPLAFGSPGKLELWVIVAAAVLVGTAAAASISLQAIQKAKADAAITTIDGVVNAAQRTAEKSFSEMISVNREIQKLTEEAVKRQAELIPRDQIYSVMARCIRHARSEVALITYLMADWESLKRTFVPASVDTPNRGEFYDAVYDAIKDPHIQYVRVWQVPQGKIEDARQLVLADETQRKECALIEDISKDHPERARLVFTDQLTTASFILVDRKHLFFNIDFYDSSKKLWYSPYMLFVKDATGESFRDLQSVIVRLTGKT